MSRQELIETLQYQGITHPRVLQAIRAVPREKFVLPTQKRYAYENTALPIDCEQTISQPYIVALMTQALLQMSGAQKILEIGTGSGYQAAVLATLFPSVWTIERIPALAKKAHQVLDKLGFKNIHYLVADGAKGWPSEAPFDGIIVTAAAEMMPHELLDQLNPEGGIMVIPLGNPHTVQRLTLIRRHGDKYHETFLEQVLFVPLVRGSTE